MPTFNGAQFLPQALETVLSQTHSDFELIICDDGSTDQTVEIIDAHCRLDKRIRFFRNDSKLGLFANYNRCIASARGEFIKPFAQDDLLHPEALERCVAVFDREDELVLVSTARGTVNDSGEPLSVDLKQIEPADTVIPGAEVLQACLYPLTNLIGEPSTVMLRARAIGEGFDSELRQLGDIEYWLRILMEGDYYLLPDELCLYRIHANSKSSQNAKGLMHGADLVRIARKFSWIIESCGQTVDDFLYRSLSGFAAFTLGQQQAQEISLSFLHHSQDLKDALSDSHKNDPAVVGLFRDTADFRELSYHLLLIMAKNANGMNGYKMSFEPIVEANYQRMRELERDLTAMLSSTSWHLTKPLRELNRLLLSSNGTPEAAPEFHLKNSDKLVLEQEEYISYLQNLISKVQSSRSWKITAPVRALTARP